MVTIKQIPTDNSLTASTNVISMQYPNTILNTKMTLPQLVGPIDVVSPEHSSGDHRVTNSKLLAQRMPALNSLKQNMHVPPKHSHTTPLQLVYPNKARSFPRSPATNTGYPQDRSLREALLAVLKGVKLVPRQFRKRHLLRAAADPIRTSLHGVLALRDRSLSEALLALEGVRQVSSSQC